MALIIRLQCDKCENLAILPTYGTATDARVEGFRDGWLFNGDADLCPVCTNVKPDYYTAEPF